MRSAHPPRVCNAADMDVPVFAAIDIGHTIDSDGETMPTVVIDASDAPAVADLARVHATEGIGDVRTEAIRTDDHLVLGVRVTVPVRATFAIVFRVDAHRSLLDDAIAHGSLVIAHTDPARAETEEPRWLAVDIDGAALRTCLDPR